MVLGELPHLSNLTHPDTFNPGLKPHNNLKNRKNTRVKKAVPTKDDANVKVNKALEIDVKPVADSDLDDPQSSEPYTSDIYTYLRNMEVILISRSSFYSLS